MDTKDAYIECLENTISNLQKQVDNLTEMVILLRKQKFGSASEKTSRHRIDGQLCLFNEAEMEADLKCEESILRRLMVTTLNLPEQNGMNLSKIFRFGKSHVTFLKKICFVISAVPF